jgi:hypothetical protein
VRKIKEVLRLRFELGFSSSAGRRVLFRFGALLDFFELGYRDGISPFADPSFLQTAEVDRALPGELRDASLGRGCDLLGCDASHLNTKGHATRDTLRARESSHLRRVGTQKAQRFGGIR